MKLTDVKPAPDDHGQPPLSPEEEAEMQAEIEGAMEQEPYKSAPRKMRANMRAELERAIRTHPDARAYLRAFAPRKAVATSGDGPIAGASTHGSEASNPKVRGKEGA